MTTSSVVFSCQLLSVCGKSGRPGVSSNVIKGLEWIKKIVGNCNKDTCDKGKCVTGETLDSDINTHFFSIRSETHSKTDSVDDSTTIRAETDTTAVDKTSGMSTVTAVGK